MCGIAGFCTGSGFEGARASKQAGAMADVIGHRGPDDSGVWVDDKSGIAMAHRRLSILDLSPAGHQPMVSVSERYVIVFNGEIYNHNKIRSELEFTGYQWRGTSDTESFLAGIETWGLELTLKKSVGMFAFALWDRKKKEISLARDRMGEKPLYYGLNNGIFFFGSELKALKAHPDFEGVVDRDSVALFLRHNYIPSPYSIYRGINKLLPGTYLCIPENKLASAHEIAPTAYWSLQRAATRGQDNLFLGDEEEALDELQRLLRQSVQAQCIADVPLGAFLSGGIDSSLVVALMQSQAARPVKTFTLGFQEEAYNEATHARKIAQHLGTEHHELYVTPKEAIDVIPRLPSMYDEPFSDSSQIPTNLVSQLARKQVTVSLSGDGGDEVFGGYNRYQWTRIIWDRVRRVPRVFRNIAAYIMRSQTADRWDHLYGLFRPVVPNSFRVAQFGSKVNTLADFIVNEHSHELYRSVVSHWKSPANVVLNGIEPETVLTAAEVGGTLGLSLEQRMMVLDSLSYLPDDILVKLDRAAMRESLETRVPLLDHRVIEFAWSLPHEMKIKDGTGKWILRRLLRKYVPPELFERPKMGFAIPLGSWLRGPIRDWAEELIKESLLDQQGFLDPKPIRKIWSEHVSSQKDHSYLLWDVLMFQAWLSEHNAR